MTQIPLPDAPIGILRKLSRDYHLNADFLHGRAAELLAQAQWAEKNSPDPTHSQHLTAIADSLNERADEIEDEIEPVDAEIARRGGSN
jgi:hypothetical protein